MAKKPVGRNLIPPRLSAWVERQRLKIVRPYVRGDVLDIGCGRGAAVALLGADQDYLGIELRAQLFRPPVSPSNRISLLTLDLDRDPLNLDRRFDTILMLAVIEHLREPDRLLTQLSPLLKSDGRVLITTPTPLGHRVHRIGARLGLFWQSAVEEHRWAFSRSALHVRINRSGLSVHTHKYFLLGGNQLFVCAADKTVEQPA